MKIRSFPARFAFTFTLLASLAACGGGGEDAASQSSPSTSNVAKMSAPGAADDRQAAPEAQEAPAGAEPRHADLNEVLAARDLRIAALEERLAALEDGGASTIPSRAEAKEAAAATKAGEEPGAAASTAAPSVAEDSQREEGAGRKPEAGPHVGGREGEDGDFGFQISDRGLQSAIRSPQSAIGAPVRLAAELGFRYHGVHVAGTDEEIVNRPELRGRLGVELDAQETVTLRVALGTGVDRQAASDWVSAGDDAGKPALRLHRLSAAWTPVSAFTLELGKLPNDFADADLIFDEALTPAGMVERLDLDALFGWASDGITAGDHDGADRPVGAFGSYHRLTLAQWYLEANDTRAHVAMFGGRWELARALDDHERWTARLFAAEYAFTGVERMTRALAAGDLLIPGMAAGATTNTTFDHSPWAEITDLRHRSAFFLSHGGATLAWTFAECWSLEAIGEYSYNFGARRSSKRLEEAAQGGLTLAFREHWGFRLEYRARMVEADAAPAPFAPEWRATNVRGHRGQAKIDFSAHVSLLAAVEVFRAEQSAMPTVTGLHSRWTTRVVVATTWRF